jgi:hypothetical protein
LAQVLKSATAGVLSGAAAAGAAAGDVGTWPSVCAKAAAGTARAVVTSRVEIEKRENGEAKLDIADITMWSIHLKTNCIAPQQEKVAKRISAGFISLFFDIHNKCG